MEFRILSREERESLTPEAVQFIYRQIASSKLGYDVIEKTLLHAFLISRLNQCQLDEEMTEFLLERVRDNDDTLFIDASDAGDAGSGPLMNFC